MGILPGENQHPLRPLLQPGLTFESSLANPAVQPLLTPLGATAQGPVGALDALLSGQTPEFLKFPGGFPFPPFPWPPQPPPPPGPSLTSLTLVPATFSLGIGQSRQLTLTGGYADDSVQDLTASHLVQWSSSDPSVLSVAHGGQVTALDVGMASVVAMISSIEAFADVTVLGVPPPPGVTLTELNVTPESGTLEVGHTQQLTATGLYSDGHTENLTADPDIEWLSNSPALATISPTGMLTPVAAGQVTIEAHHSGIMGTSSWVIAVVPPPPPPPPPPPASLVSMHVDPASFTIGIGELKQLTATGHYSDGTTRNVTNRATWSSVNPLVADVSSSGVVTGRSAGTVLITAALGVLRVSSTITVSAVPPPPPPPDGGPPTRIVTGPLPNGFTVGAGEIVEFRGHLPTPKSVIVHRDGELRMWGANGPVHLEFTDIDNSLFVGGHEMHADTDIGLFVEEGGRLNIRGTPKATWGYGMVSHPTWKSTDHMVVAPLNFSEIVDPGGSISALGIGGFQRHILGNPVRMMPDGRPLPVFNLTRDVKITGTPNRYAHIRIHLMAQARQTIEYLEIDWGGVPRIGSDGNNDGVLGRYGLHFHECGEFSRGSTVKGVVVKRGGNWGIVTHTSHGVTHTENIVYDMERGAFTWDPGTITNDCLYDKCVGAFIHFIPGYRGYRLNAFNLQNGTNNTVRDCLAAGILGNRDASGFHWPEPAGPASLREAIWKFEGVNVSLANKNQGIFTWQNTPREHLVPTSGKWISINCGRSGIDHGAYTNAYQYGVFGPIEIYCPPGGTGIIEHAMASQATVFRNDESDYGKYSLAYQDLKIVGGLHGVEIVKHTLLGSRPVLYLRLQMTGQTGKKVMVDQRDSKRGLHDFVNCGITPSDVEIINTDPGTIIRIQQGTQAWRITPGAVTSIPPFYRP